MSIVALLNLLAASGLAGTLLPVLVAMVNQEHWSAKVKGLVTGTLSLAGGVFAAWQQGQLGRGWWIAAVAVLLVASGSYQVFWKPTRLAPIIEALTTWAAQHPAEAKK